MSVFSAPEQLAVGNNGSNRPTRLKPSSEKK